MELPKIVIVAQLLLCAFCLVMWRHALNRRDMWRNRCLALEAETKRNSNRMPPN